MVWHIANLNLTDRNSTSGEELVAQGERNIQVDEMTNRLDNATHLGGTEPKVGEAGVDSNDTDTLNERIGVLTRRETEARILAPILRALEEEFGAEKVREIVGKEIVKLARQQGQALAESMASDTLTSFEDSLQYWTMGGALEIDVVERSAEVLSFDVTRCRYAELYRSLGIAELGSILSCNRDHALIEGYNPDVELTRTQTIMDGAATCDFRYRLRSQNRPSTKADV